MSLRVAWFQSDLGDLCCMRQRYETFRSVAYSGYVVSRWGLCLASKGSFRLIQLFPPCWKLYLKLIGHVSYRVGMLAVTECCGMLSVGCLVAI